MPRFELSPQALSQIADKLSRTVGTINPKDPVYEGAFDGVPEELRDEWVAAIKDGASLIGLDARSYGKELAKIAVENGLAPKGIRFLPKDLFSNLRRRVATLREAVMAHEGIGMSPNHALGTHISTSYGRKR